jgi:hypothetical protein
MLTETDAVAVLPAVSFGASYTSTCESSLPLDGSAFDNLRLMGTGRSFG